MIRSALWTRVWNFAGLVCLAMSLLLLPAGVRSVRAADGDGVLMSVDPSLLPSQSAILGEPPAAPVIRACEVDAVLRARPSAPEAQAGIIMLNMRGYNYGPVPSPLDPAALRLERAIR